MIQNQTHKSCSNLVHFFYASSSFLRPSASFEDVSEVELPVSELEDELVLGCGKLAVDGIFAKRILKKEHLWV